MKKAFTTAVLPFQGQKRNWNSEFKTALKANFADCTTFIDLFGGSGLLSRMCKDVRPDAQVIYNDFDDFHKRVQSIDSTNALLAKIRLILADYPRGKALSENLRLKVLEVIKEADTKGFVDYITLSPSLLFSMNYAANYNELAKQGMYNTVRRTDYEAAAYLDGLEIVKYDYKELFAKYRHVSNVCFIVDPPYLSTDAQTYSNYWRLKDYLDALHTLKGTNYFFFTSNKSSLLELCEWIEVNLDATNPFAGATKKELTAHMSHKTKYVDIMLFKHR